MSPSASLGARQRSVLIIHPRLPAHDEDSGSRRLRWIVELLVARGHRVTFVGHSGWNQARYAQQLRDLGVEVHEYNGAWWRAHGAPGVPTPGLDVEGLLRRGRFDLAWLSTYEMGEFYLADLRRLSPATRIVLDTVDVHHVRELRGAELSGDPADYAKAERVRAAEAAVYTSVDRLVAVSEPDAAVLRAMAPDVPVSVVSNVHAIPEPGPGFAARHGLVFVGSFAHTPNVGAITGFVADVWPHVRAAVPDATLAIVGTNPPPAVQALAGEGITVTGWVPETRPYLDAARVSIAPLRWGAGVKGKIGEAMSLGVPVVTTTVGAEGMGLADGEQALIADDDAGMAAAIARAHTDPELWARLAAAGPVHIDRTLGTGAARAALDAILDAMLPTPFVVTDAWSSPEALPAVLRAYLAAFTAEDPVSLVLPTPGDPEAAIGRALEALAALGADPAAIPDVAILEAVDRAPVPWRGVRVGAASWREPGEVVTIAPDAAPEAWRAAAAAPGGTPDPGRPLVSIVICLYGKRDYTERCLASLDRALGAKLGGAVELVLVDNASPDDTAELLDAWEDRATVLRLAKNHNFAGGNNAGAAAATGRVLLFLNNDTEVPAGVVEELAAEALRPSVGVVGPRLRYPDGRLQHGGYAWRATEDGDVVAMHMFYGEDGELPLARASFDTAGATGACIALRSELFDAVGGFDAGYVNGFEDADLGQRVRATGARIRYRGDLEVVHHEGITSGRDYAQGSNEARFRGAWRATLQGDDELVARQLGAHLGVLKPERRNGIMEDGAEAVVVGPVLGIGPLGDEARALLWSLQSEGDVGARTPAPTWIRPALDPAAQAALSAVHARMARPGAATIVIADGSLARPEAPVDGGPVDPAFVAAATAPSVVRLADVPDAIPAGAAAWAATPGLAAALVAAGWGAERVFVVPPQRVDAPVGPGGGGLLAGLPDHDHTVRDAVLEALRGARAADVAVLPTARTSELAARVAASVPGAELLTPLTDEGAFGLLAGRADVVLAVDPADRFDRRALLSAAAGAAVVVRPGGPAAELLGGLAVVADPSDPEALAAALARVDTSPEARDARAAAVRAVCGPEAVVRAFRALAGAPDHRTAGIEAFGRGDVRTALAELELALAAGYDADVASDLAVVCHAAGDVERAAALLEECLARVPDHAGARENLALLAQAPAA
jgi:GT2 family glycosyltransferase/glycosyltransferase involved in cell wall biosynthesis